MKSYINELLFLGFWIPLLLRLPKQCVHSKRDLIFALVNECDIGKKNRWFEAVP